MAPSSGRVPMLDTNGRFPDRFAPPSVASDAAAAATARTGAEAAAAGVPAAVAAEVTTQVDPKVTAAQTARTGAETARTGAETARAGAEAARTQAQAAQTAAEAVPTTNDGITQSLVNNTGSATRAALNATYATPAAVSSAVAPKLDKTEAATTYAMARRAVYGPRWVFDGDSITINGISATADYQDRTRSWTSEMSRQSMGRIRYVRNAAIAGQRIDQMLARFDTAITPYDPDVVMLTAGTNDIRQSRTMAQWKADLIAYFEKCKAIGADLVVGAIWPSDDNPTYAATARTWNSELYTWAAANDVQVIPWDTLADPISGGWPTGWSTDGLHPAVVGADAYATIGKLGWLSVEPKAGPVNLRRAVSNGADALTNGFFANLTAVQAAPNLTAGTPDTSSGTLPAGTYEYKYTSRTYWGESLPSALRSVTLSATGKITITNTTVSGCRSYMVYRKGPGDATYKLLTQLTPSTTTTFTDDGSLAPGADMPGVDTSQYPVGLVCNTATLHKIGPVTYTEAGVRGRIFRSMPLEAAGAPNDYFLVAGMIPGDSYSASCLIRSTGTTEGVFIIRFRNAANVAIGQVYIARDRMINGFGLAQNTFTVPATADSVRVSFEQTDSASTGYAEFAEIQFRKLN